MRFVIDLNVLLSAAFFHGSIPYQAFEKARSSGVLLTSAPVMAELMDVLNRPKFQKYLSDQDKNAFLQKYILLSKPIKIEHQVTSCRDSKDNKYLE